MNKYTLSILGAGCLWGFMGMFTRHLTDYGFSTQAAVIARCGFASLCFGILLLVRDKKLFRVHLRDIWCFLGLGLCSLLFFTYCYFQCIALTSLSMAAVLLYTAPGIVMLISLFLFREKLTLKTVIGLILGMVAVVVLSI